MNRKKRSRLLACIMIIAMFCTMFPVTAFAGENTSVTIGNGTVAPGHDVTIPITIANHSDIGFADLYLHYDMSALTLKQFNTSPSIFRTIPKERSLPWAGITSHWETLKIW